MLRLDETRDKNASPRRELCPENFYPIGFAAVLHSDESVRRQVSDQSPTSLDFPNVDVTPIYSKKINRSSLIEIAVAGYVK